MSDTTIENPISKFAICALGQPNIELHCSELATVKLVADYNTPENATTVILQWCSVPPFKDKKPLPVLIRHDHHSDWMDFDGNQSTTPHNHRDTAKISDISSLILARAERPEPRLSDFTGAWFGQIATQLRNKNPSAVRISKTDKSYCKFVVVLDYQSTIFGEIYLDHGGLVLSKNDDVLRVFSLSDTADYITTAICDYFTIPLI